MVMLTTTSTTVVLEDHQDRGVHQEPTVSTLVATLVVVALVNVLETAIALARRSTVLIVRQQEATAATLMVLAVIVGVPVVLVVVVPVAVVGMVVVVMGLISS
jgi:hypothetical protein